MDRQEYTKLVTSCKKDYEEAVGKKEDPTRSWIRAWMQTNYHMVKIPSYLYRMFFC
jgi:hypothetical protein